MAPPKRPSANRKRSRGGAVDEDEPALEDVRRRLAQLENRVARIESGAPRTEPARTEPTPAPTAAPTAPSEPGHAEPAQGWTRVPDPPASPAASPPTSPAASPVREKRDIEEVLGANWLAKVGVGLLALGMVFLFQYAVAQGWLTLPMQIILGFLGGVALFVLGDFLFARKRMPTYGQILAGGGAAIAYFSVFASYVFGEYREAMSMSLELAALLLGMVALGVLAYAALRRTPVLASVAAVLGAVTVVFAGLWPLFVVAYVLVWTTAFLVVAWWRDWPREAGIAMGAALASLLIGTLVTLDTQAAVWAATGVAAFGLAAAAISRWDPIALGVMPGLTVVLLVTGIQEPMASLYAGALLAIAVGIVARWREWLQVQIVALVAVMSLLFMLAFYAFNEFSGADAALFGIVHLVALGVVASFSCVTLVSLSFGVEEFEQNWVGGAVAFAALATWGIAVHTLEQAGWGADANGWVTLGLAVIVTALAFVPNLARPVRFGWFAAGIVLWLAWPPIHLSGTPVTLFWTAYVAALGAYLLYRPTGWVVRTFMGAAGVLVLFRLFFIHWGDLNAGELAWGLGLLLYGFASAAFLVAWVGEQRRKDSEQAEPEAIVGWLWLAAALAVPILYFTAALEGYLVSVAWAAQAVVLVVLGFALQQKPLRLAALGVFALVLFRLLIFDMQEVDTGLRIISFLAVGVLLIVAAYFFARRVRAAAGDPAREEGL